MQNLGTLSKTSQQRLRMHVHVLHDTISINYQGSTLHPSIRTHKSTGRCQLLPVVHPDSRASQVGARDVAVAVCGDHAADTFCTSWVARHGSQGDDIVGAGLLLDAVHEDQEHSPPNTICNSLHPHPIVVKDVQIRHPSPHQRAIPRPRGDFSPGGYAGQNALHPAQHSRAGITAQTASRVGLGDVTDPTDVARGGLGAPTDGSRGGGRGDGGGADGDGGFDTELGDQSGKLRNFTKYIALVCLPARGTEPKLNAW
mmetsp:Transcript_36171/g.81635  ORF Transcript_36171/g.81635 Transcript_36171/m.81635 type:complete len:256 (-) Transcript_36171:556-1323(-)